MATVWTAELKNISIMAKSSVGQSWSTLILEFLPAFHICEMEILGNSLSSSIVLMPFPFCLLFFFFFSPTWDLCDSGYLYPLILNLGAVPCSRVGDKNRYLRYLGQMAGSHEDGENFQKKRAEIIILS